MATFVPLEASLAADDRLRAGLIENAPQALLLLDLEGQLHFANAAARAALGDAVAHPSTGDWLTSWSEEDRPAARRAMAAARAGSAARFIGTWTHGGRERSRWEVGLTAANDAAGNPERLLASLTPETELTDADLVLRLITEEAAATGVDFFQLLARRLARSVQARYAFVAECTTADRTQVRTLAFWRDEKFVDNVSYPLRGTPCEGVVGGSICSYPERVQTLFPEDKDLVTLGAEGYVGVPLRDVTGAVLGHMAVMDDRPLHPEPHQLAAFKVFAARAGAEVERLRAHRQLERTNRELAALVEINRAISSHLDRDALFGAVAECLDTLVPAERFGIELPIEGGQLQGSILSHRPAPGEAAQSSVLPALGTACDWVIQRGEWYVIGERDELRERFPVTFDVMESSGMESLLALPLASGARPVAALFFMSSARGAYSDLRRDFLDQVAGAVGVALDNCMAHEQLRREGIEALARSEERFRDLFEEAPIAYVNEGLDSRFISANRAAMRILGITPDQVEGTYGKSLVPDTPEAQRRLEEAFTSIGQGTDTSGVVLELRRRDNGKPIWIQWWSKPDPAGQFTRTMFVDITEQVTMEREKARLEAQNTYLRDEITTQHDLKEFIGTSAGINKVLQAIQRVASTDATVLIMGETGTGKELVDRAVHNQSGRRDGVLVKVNCAAIPAGLIESELFGHERGAFTGALARKIGRFELADRGTLFLDEVGEIPLDLQTKLLRVLQEGEFERLGSTRTQKVNVRIIAATNRDLHKEVREGRFRSDLYYRLNVFPIEVPPLRDRKEDLPLLVAHFIRKHTTALGRRVDRVSARSMELLERYSWPGNIRELEHVIERGIILSPGPTLEVDDWMPRQIGLAAGVGGPGDASEPGDDTLEDAERRHILQVLERTDWRVSGERGAAKILGLKPTTLEARMKRLGIRREGSR
jgi:PAS domain S-box-containing protein